ncbi:MAG: alpha/beta hydrolase [Candidatus Aminicenantales bacterium]
MPDSRLGGGSDAVKTGELRIAFERKGEGQPLVLLHGALSDSREWRRQLDDLSADLTVVAWDAPGCGRSSDPPETFRLSDYADCLAEFIEAIGLKRPHLLGLSFGGGLALEFYRRHPSVPKTLILASAYAGWAGSLPPEVVEERLQKGLRQSEWPPDQVVKEWIPTLFTKSVPAGVVDEAAAIMSEFHPAGMRTMLLAFAEADLRDVLPTIGVPTLLLYGDADQRSPLAVAENLHAKIPTSKLVILPGVGHASNLEAPEVFNAEVRNFLRSNRS